jgi:hypothetical protein
MPGHRLALTEWQTRLENRGGDRGEFPANRLAADELT